MKKSTTSKLGMIEEDNYNAGTYTLNDVKDNNRYSENNLQNYTKKDYDTDVTYTICDAVDEGGYGRFQRFVTFMTGLTWISASIEITITSILGDFLACEWTLYRWQNAVMTCVVFLGNAAAGPLFGKVADYYGRRWAVGITLLLTFVFGSLVAASPNYTAVLIFRFLLGFPLGGLAQSMTLCCEYYPTKGRGRSGFTISYYWTIGTLLIILIAWLIMSHTNDNWQLLSFVAALPSAVVLLLIKCFPESARYYLVSNQYEKAVKQLEKMAQVNKKSLPNGKLKQIPESALENRGQVIDLFRNEHRRSSLLLMYMWFGSSFAYYGIMLMSPIIIKEGSLTNIHPNGTSSFFTTILPCQRFTSQNYIDLLWTNAAEIPGLFIYWLVCDKLNRKTLLSIGFALTCIGTPLLLIDFSQKVYANILLFILRGNQNSAFHTVYIVTAESFPTNLRALAMGWGTCTARLGAALVPFLAQALIIVSPEATVSILSAMCFLLIIATLCLPLETRDQHLKDQTSDQNIEDTTGSNSPSEAKL